MRSAHIKILFLTLLLFLFATPLYASTDLAKQVLDIVVEFMEDRPVFGTVIFITGLLRLIFKPFVKAAEKYVKYTPYDKDDMFLEDVKNSKAFECFAFFLDYFASIKAPRKR